MNSGRVLSWRFCLSLRVTRVKIVFDRGVTIGELNDYESAFTFMLLCLLLCFLSPGVEGKQTLAVDEGLTEKK